MERVAFTTPGVLRIFLACKACGRTVPHYRVYGHVQGRCKCGHSTFIPTTLPEWKAAWYVLVIGWLWRKTLRKYAEWDPRMPVREMEPVPPVTPEPPHPPEWYEDICDDE